MAGKCVNMKYNTLKKYFFNEFFKYEILQSNKYIQFLVL